MKIVIDIQDMSWIRNKKTILSDINWQVKKGEHWAILGLNGSGKTSLLQLINGYTWPTTGKMNVLGHSFGSTDLREVRKSIGWVSSSLEERVRETELTQNIVVSGKYASIGLYEQPAATDYDQAYDFMKQLNCQYLIDRAYHTCSNGEKQRILIARSLMASPGLLILDEPSNGLDFIAREQLMSTIKQLAIEENTPTIILVTHHIEEVVPLFSQTLLLKDGTIFDQGNREDVLKSASLSHFFDKNIQINWHQDRPWMTLLDDR